MKSYFLKRITSTLLILLGVLTLTFILIYLVPGDPVQNFTGQHADAQTLSSIRKELGLDRPLFYQWMQYISNVLHGHLGRSYFTHENILKNLMERFPITFFLALLATLIGGLMGIPTGIFAAIRPHSIWDKGIMTLTLFAISLPVFWMGILILIFASRLDTLPLLNTFSSLTFNLILAAFVLGIRPTALLSRITRNQMIEILKEDYILSARARGLSQKRIILVHALRNALGPILTTLALDFGSLLSGAAITETIFGIPGIGKYALTGLGRRDYPVVMGMVLFSAFIFVTMNFIADMIIYTLNPKLRVKT
ncbi:MAG: ABC transporter permease [Chlamydiae bacterium]|nr:ABC transporter permease [Chlamydiota bacterium]MBI3278197.1 ABC transporter permease [Chlamydiota bacterium]